MATECRDFRCSLSIRSMPDALLFFIFLIVDFISFSVIRKLISLLILCVSSIKYWGWSVSHSISKLAFWKN